MNSDLHRLATSVFGVSVWVLLSIATLSLLRLRSVRFFPLPTLALKVVSDGSQLCALIDEYANHLDAFFGVILVTGRLQPKDVR